MYLDVVRFRSYTSNRYSTDTFKKAGIANPPATWDEFVQDAVKIHALSPSYY